MGGEAETSQDDLDLRASEDFLVGNRDLERLEALRGEYEISTRHIDSPIATRLRYDRVAF